jgi:hypothetical protein
MNITRLTLRFLVVSTLLSAAASLAHAQATRTFVSGVGDDVNPCSRTAPCKTFAGTLSKTAINGEMNVLDPGSYGGATIVKSITIDGTGTFAGIMASSTTGISINLSSLIADDPNKIVRLRGLSINGAGVSGTIGTRTGIRGILVSSLNTYQPKVIIEDVVIDGFVNEGVLWAANGGEMVINNSSIRNNGTAAVRADSNGANPVYLTIDDTHMDMNVQEGLRIEDNIIATVTNSHASNNGLNGFVVTPATVPSELNLDNSTAASNKQVGVFSITTGAGTSTIRISNMEITNNLVNGLQSNGGGLICSNTKNRITTPTQASNCAFADQ